MTTRAIERVDEWDTRPFGGGYRGLHDLADRDFSGVVRSPAGTLCMLNGAVVGIVDGRIEDFEGADGTAYEAPCQALPLLIVMQNEAEDVRAKYYTEDTPLSKVDSTLSDGGFTGFIELSENVLSGDYYVVYQGGRSMSVAFVGNSGQLLSDDEAFERADDEVGIYEVRDVDIEPVDIPEPPESESETAGGGVAEPGTTEAVDETPASQSGERAGTDESETASTDSTESADTAESATASTDATAQSQSSGTGTTSGGGPTEQGTVTRDPAERTESAEAETEPSGTAGGATADSEEENEAAEGPAADRTAQSAPQPATERPERSAKNATAEAASEETTAEETAEKRETVPTEETPTTQSAESKRTEQTNSGGAQADASRTQSGQADPNRGATGQSSERKETGATERGNRTAGAGRAQAPAPSERSTGGSTRSGGAGSAADLETRTIPSLDPDRSQSASSGGSHAGTAGPSQSSPPAHASGSAGGRGGSQSTSGSTETDDRGSTAADTESTASQSSGEAASQAGQAGTNRQSQTGTHRQTDQAAGGRGSGGPSAERVEELETTISEREERIEDLEGKLATVREERDELESERDELQSARDELERERDDLEETLERVRGELKRLREERDTLESQLESAEGVDPDAGERRLSPSEAMDGTDLFVRYDSKGEPTLKTAHESGASRSDVNENLNVEWHTQFETDGAVVGGQPFETYLQNTIEYRFVSWMVRELLFEIRETGHHNALSDLYDALPLIDRAELNGEAAVEYTEDGQTKQSREAFDVVLRDRMGNPLVVANFNDTRQAATEDDMRSLVTSATRVGETAESLAGAMYVTASFFEPEALEMASDATGGGLLSRDKRESFVKVSRKQGYHLCLVEARDQQFHMAVPEL